MSSPLDGVAGGGLRGGGGCGGGGWCGGGGGGGDCATTGGEGAGGCVVASGVDGSCCVGGPAGAPGAGPAGTPPTGDSGGAVCRLTSVGGDGGGGRGCGGGLRTVDLGTAKAHQALVLRSLGVMLGSQGPIENSTENDDFVSRKTCRHAAY